jgi:NADH-quinone oxidoreductase subunit M
MLHAGVLKKFGLYGLMRIALPLLPDGAAAWLPVVAVLAVGNLLWAGWVAMRQRDLNLLLGNSSVAHMGFAFLGIASLTVVGLTGAVVVMVAHGLVAALSFGLSGFLYKQTGTLQMDQLGGLLRPLPFIGAALAMALLAGCGLPGFANFVGELLVLLGVWGARTLPGAWIGVAAAWAGLIIGAVYALGAVRTILHGPLPVQWVGLTDARLWRKSPFVVLLAVLLLFGCVPRLLTDRVAPATAQLVNRAAKVNPQGPVNPLLAHGP